MSRHYCTCPECGREMESGSQCYVWVDRKICESCFDDFQLREKKEAETTVETDDCDDYDGNEGCWSYKW